MAFPEGPLKTKFEKILFKNRRISVINFYNGTPCWEWTGSLSHNGYGKTTINNTTTRVHRLAAKIYLSNYSRELLVCHHCDNPKCFNPLHLYIGTQTENMLDSYAKGRKQNQHIGKTHCVRGHEFNNKNTYIKSNGVRQCRKCNLINVHIYRSKRKRRFQSK